MAKKRKAPVGTEADVKQSALNQPTSKKKKVNNLRIETNNNQLILCSSNENSNSSSDDISISHVSTSCQTHTPTHQLDEYFFVAEQISSKASQLVDDIFKQLEDSSDSDQEYSFHDDDDEDDSSENRSLPNIMDDDDSSENRSLPNIMDDDDSSENRSLPNIMEEKSETILHRSNKSCTDVLIQESKIFENIETHQSDSLIHQNNINSQDNLNRSQQNRDEYLTPPLKLTSCYVSLSRLEAISSKGRQDPQKHHSNIKKSVSLSYYRSSRQSHFIPGTAEFPLKVTDTFPLREVSIHERLSLYNIKNSTAASTKTSRNNECNSRKNKESEKEKDNYSEPKTETQIRIEYICGTSISNFTSEPVMCAEIMEDLGEIVMPKQEVNDNENSQTTVLSVSACHPIMTREVSEFAPLAALSSYPSLGCGPSPVPKTGRKYMGAHISAAGGIYKVFQNAEDIEAKSFAMFLRNQRQWVAKPYDEKDVEKYHELAKDFPPHLILPHGSYLMNIGSSKPELLEKSRNLLEEELKRCLQLNIPHFNFHPGSCVGGVSREACCLTIAESINLVHKKVPKVILVLENMCKQGNTIGGDFHELRLIIENVTDRTRVGVCIDTCHAHNAGFDLSSAEGFNQMMDDFEKIIGFQFLRGLHINDSKNPSGAHVDRHENIGKGFIGKEGMQRIMNCDKFNDLPMILETPWVSDEGYAKEIKMLEEMVDDEDCK